MHTYIKSKTNTVQNTYTYTDTATLDTQIRTNSRKPPEERQNNKEDPRVYYSTETKPSFAAGADRHHQEERQQPEHPKLKKLHRHTGFVNRQEEHQRCPHVAVDRGSGNNPKLTFNLRIRILPTTKSWNSTRSACLQPLAQNGTRIQAARRHHQQIDGQHSCRTSPIFPPALEETPA